MNPRRGLGLVGRGPLFVPVLIFGVWTAAGAAGGGTGDGEVTPFLLAIASILWPPRSEASRSSG